MHLQTIHCFSISNAVENRKAIQPICMLQHPTIKHKVFSRQSLWCIAIALCLGFVFGLFNTLSLFHDQDRVIDHTIENQLNTFQIPASTAQQEAIKSEIINQVNKLATQPLIDEIRVITLEDGLLHNTSSSSVTESPPWLARMLFGADRFYIREFNLAEGQTISLIWLKVVADITQPYQQFIALTTKALLLTLVASVLLAAFLIFMSLFLFHKPVISHKKPSHRKTTANVYHRPETLNADSVSVVKSESASTLLVVDDNPVNRMVAAEMLQQLGFSVDRVESGYRCLEHCQQKNYDVIFMDCNMPGMDGFSTTQHLRKHPNTKHIPVVALTANALSEHKEKCLQAGMNDYIAKPFNKRKLQETLSKWLP